MSTNTPTKKNHASYGSGTLNSSGYYEYKGTGHNDAAFNKYDGFGDISCSTGECGLWLYYNYYSGPSGNKPHDVIRYGSGFYTRSQPSYTGWHCSLSGRWTSFSSYYTYDATWDVTLTVNWEINKYWSDLNLCYPGTGNQSAGTCSISYTYGGTTYASGDNLGNENWNYRESKFPHGTYVKIWNIKPNNGMHVSSVMLGDSSMSYSGGYYYGYMYGNADVNITMAYNTPTITFNFNVSNPETIITNYSSATKSRKFTCFTDIGTIVSPQREGYDFVRYYCSSAQYGCSANETYVYGKGSKSSPEPYAGTTGIVATDADDDIWGDITLYAEWKGRIYSVTLVDNTGTGGLGTVYHRIGSGGSYYKNSSLTGTAYTTLTKPTKSYTINGTTSNDYYTFLGYYNDTKYDKVSETTTSKQYVNSSGKPSSDLNNYVGNITINAHWGVKKYIVQYIFAEGDASNQSIGKAYIKQPNGTFTNMQMTNVNKIEDTRLVVSGTSGASWQNYTYSSSAVYRYIRNVNVTPNNNRGDKLTYILNTKLSSDACLNTTNSHSKLYFENSAYELIGWLFADSGYPPYNNGYGYYDIYTKTLTNIEYMNNNIQVKTKTPSPQFSVVSEDTLYANTTDWDYPLICLYAVYATREVSVGVSTYGTTGAISGEQGNTDLRAISSAPGYYNVQYGVSFDYTTNDQYPKDNIQNAHKFENDISTPDYTSSSAVKTTKVALGSTITFKIQLSDTTGQKKYGTTVLDYNNTSDKIEVDGVELTHREILERGLYKFDVKSYRISKIVFEKFPTGTNDSDIKDLTFLFSENSDTPISGSSTYSSSLYNVISFKSSESNSVMTITISNINYANNGSTFGTSSVYRLYKNDSADRAFAIKVYATPIEEKTDSYKITGNFNNTFDTATTFVPNGGYIAVPATKNGNNYSFWLNGVSCGNSGLTKSSFSYTGTDNKTFSGYYYIQEYQTGKYMAYIIMNNASTYPNNDGEYSSQTSSSFNKINGNIRTNFGTTEIFFIEPQQSLVYNQIQITSGYSDSDTKLYEPNSYLSSIQITNSSNKNVIVSSFYLNKVQSGNTYSQVYGVDSPEINGITGWTDYKENNVDYQIGWERLDNDNNKSNTYTFDKFIPTYKYNGVTYTIVEGYKLFTREKDEDETKEFAGYTLYLGYDKVSHKILYILTGNGVNNADNLINYNKQTQNKISFIMSDFDQKIEINYSVQSSDKIPQNNSGNYLMNNAEIQNFKVKEADKKSSYQFTKIREANSDGTIPPYTKNPTTDVPVKETYTNTGYYSYSVNKLSPSSGAIIKLSPQDGYLINTINIRLTDNKDTNIYNDLVQLYLSDVDVSKTNVYSLVGGKLEGNQETATINIIYEGVNSSFKSLYGADNTNALGIYYKFDSAATFGNLGKNFETVFLYVSGIYGNLSIDVETISYFEFDVIGDFASISDFRSRISFAAIESDGTTYSEFTGEGSTNNKNFASYQAIQKSYQVRYSSGVTTHNSTEAKVGRLLFLGYGKVCEHGFAIFMSGANYSYYLTEARFYNESKNANYGATENPFNLASNRSQFKYNYHPTTNPSGLTYNKDAKCIYYEIYNNKNANALIKHFNVSSKLDSGKIFAKKWKAVFTAFVNTTEMTSVSKIGNENYQDDNPSTKTGTWFNDTTITNIYYKYPGSLKTNTLTSTNWQDVNFYGKDNAGVVGNAPKETQVKQTIYGYDIHFEYHLIPGYSLDHVIFTSNLFDDPVPANIGASVTPANNNPVPKVSGGIAYSYYYRYYISDGDPIYDFYLYAVHYDDEYKTNTDFVSRKNNLAVLSDNFSIDVYSKAYKINVTFNSNDKEEVKNGNDVSYVARMSSIGDLQILENGGKVTKVAGDSTSTYKYTDKQDYFYDQETKFMHSASIPGYTFIGWASKNYYSMNNTEFSTSSRFESNSYNLNIWHTQSSWEDISIYFSQNNRSELLALSDASHREKPHSADFYIKDSYFMTDTGFVSGSSYRGSSNMQEQNYNFWSAYLSTFTVLKANYEGISEENFEYNINLYAIWKANTYYVSLNLNDANVGNGSTKSEITQKVGSNYGDFTTIDGSGIILPQINKLKYNQNYDLFVTFDTNQWYMIQKTGSQDPFSTNENYNSLFNRDNNNRYANTFVLDFKEFIIDRYGYSWLGWFAEKLDNVFEENDYYSYMTNTKYPTKSQKYSSTKDYAVMATEKYSNTPFKMFNYDTYKNVFGKTINGNYTSYVKEINSNQQIPYYNDPLYEDKTIELKANGSDYSNAWTTDKFYNNSVYSSQLYATNGLFFYAYPRKSTKLTGTAWYCSDDSFNLKKYTLSKTNLTYNLVNDITITYYDTMLNYSYYNLSITTKNSNNQDVVTPYTYYYGDKNTSTFRYVTLYAYWQTNLYNIDVSLLDNSVSGSLQLRYGSSTVSRANTNNFLPAYFDDTTLSNRLKTYLPTRIGYDFVGWTFKNSVSNNNYIIGKGTANSKIISINSKNIVIGDVESEITDNIDKYLYLNATLTDYLYTSVLSNGQNVYPSMIDNLSSNSFKEQLGAEEVNHRVYLFAIWSVQSFTINVSLNVEGEVMENLYDYDSELALALYESAGYTGLNTNFLKQTDSTANKGKYTFTDISANLQFVVDFDEYLSTATLVTNTMKSSAYTLDNLYATSLGYYFNGWSIKEKAGNQYVNNMVISNTNNTSYTAAGALVNENINGSVTWSDKLFDQTLYEKVVSLKIDQIVNSDIAHSVIYNKKLEDNNSVDVELNAIDYDAVQNYTYKKGTVGALTDYYDTMAGSTNSSTNFGYVKVDYTDNVGGSVNSVSYKYYIKYGTHTNNDGNNLYFVDRFGQNITIVPYVEYKENNKTLAYIGKPIGSNTTSILTYDNNSFYYDNYIVNFDKDGNAYYVTNTYKDRVPLEINFAVLHRTVDGTTIKYTTPDSNNDNNKYIGSYKINSIKMQAYLDNSSHTESLVSYSTIKLTLQKTRIFTAYAEWEIKDNLTMQISNTNITEGEIVEADAVPTVIDDAFLNRQTQNKNYGLAGYYYINNLSKNRVSHTTRQTQEYIDSIYTFYNDMYLFIAPYYNGRYLSNIEFEFYAFEQEPSTFKISKVTYILSLPFTWNSNKHIIELGGWKLYRDKEEVNIGNISNVISGINDNNLAVTNIQILSLLDQTIFNRGSTDYPNYKLLEISNYINNILGYGEFDKDGNNVITNAKVYDRTLGVEGRTDVNYLQMRLSDLMTSVKVRCEFSVQTYDLEVFNVFDTLGNTLKEKDNGNYDVAYSSLGTFLGNSKSIYLSSGSIKFEGSEELTVPDTVKPVALCDKYTNVAIVQQKTNVESKTYNVPYGFYIYGKSYDGYIRPIDVGYNSTTNVGYNPSIYTGYDYLYSYGIYKYGKSDYPIKRLSEADNFSDQCSPILGSKTSVAKSLREVSALYEFVSWYTPKILEDDFELQEYDRNREATIISNNIVLIGYYYANNKPTSLQFYTWDDKTNSYVKYENNKDEYTLNSNTKNIQFTNKQIELQLTDTAKNYMDENGNVILMVAESFGIDGSEFTNFLKYKNSEISSDVQENREFLEDNVIRQYWFYEFATTYIYYEETVNGQKVLHQIKYNPEGIVSSKNSSVRLYFYYLIDETLADTSSNRIYVQLFSTNLNDKISVTINPHTDSYVALASELTTNEVFNTIASAHNFVDAKLINVYDYQLDGSDMFAYEVTHSENDMGKYYKINKIEDFWKDTNLTAADKTKIRQFFDYKSYDPVTGEPSGDAVYKNPTARFYTKINGELYYLIATTSSESYSAKTFYSYKEKTFDTTGSIYQITYDSSNQTYSVVIGTESQPIKLFEDYATDTEYLSTTDIATMNSIKTTAGLRQPKYYTKDTNSAKGTLYFLFDNELVRTIETYSISFDTEYYYVNINNTQKLLKAIANYDKDNSLSQANKTTISQIMANPNIVTKPTYYTFDDSGKLYFLTTSKLPTRNFTDNLYVYTDGGFPTTNFNTELNLFIESGFVKTNNAFEIRNLDYYYMKANNKYFKVNYTVMSEAGSLYYNPYSTTNICNYEIEYTIRFNPGASEPYTVVLNDNKTRPVRLIENSNDDETLLDDLDKAEINSFRNRTDIELPTYYTKDSNGILYYAFIDNITASETVLNLYRYIDGMFKITQEVAYFNYSNKLFYTNPAMTERLATRAFYYKSYTPVNTNYSIKLEVSETGYWEYRGVTINSLPSPNIGFWYNNDTYAYVGYVGLKQGYDLDYISNTSAKADFVYRTENVYDEDGKLVLDEYGQPKTVVVCERIYDVFENYINIVYASSDELIKEQIMGSSKKQCGKYSDIAELQKILITVDKFYTSAEKNVNSVEQVDLIIPVTFNLDYYTPMYIKSGEKEETDIIYNSSTPFDDTTQKLLGLGSTQIATLATLAVKPADYNTNASQYILVLRKHSDPATISIKYKTNVITKSTTIDTTIYAIPIYSKNVMEFTDDSLTKSGAQLQITPDEMYVNYFENIGNIDTRYYNADDGDFMEFAVLNETEFKLLRNSLDYPDQLTYLINSDKYDIEILTEKNKETGKANKFVTENFARLDEETNSYHYDNGTYYIVGYYKKMGNFDYIIRTSDNVVKVEVTTDSTRKITYSIENYFQV